MKTNTKSVPALVKEREDFASHQSSWAISWTHQYFWHLFSFISPCNHKRFWTIRFPAEVKDHVQLGLISHLPFILVLFLSSFPSSDKGSFSFKPHLSRLVCVCECVLIGQCVRKGASDSKLRRVTKRVERMRSSKFELQKSWCPTCEPWWCESEWWAIFGAWVVVMVVVMVVERSIDCRDRSPLTRRPSVRTLASTQIELNRIKRRREEVDNWFTVQDAHLTQFRQTAAVQTVAAPTHWC